MAYPMYRTAVNIPTGADLEGKWKALWCSDTAGKTVKVDLCGGGGEGITFYTPAYGLIPVCVEKVYNTGTNVTDGRLTGLN